MDLVLSGVSKAFGGVRAVERVTFTVRARTIFGLIGPNGAGKTTVFNLVTGVYAPDVGAIRLGDRSLVGLPPARIAAAGIARTFQNVRLFGQLSVLENLLVAREARERAGLAAALARSRAHEGVERTAHERAIELLRVFELERFACAPSTSLSYGHQRRLEIARAMMLEPRVLLLDEPAAGLSTAEADALTERIRWLRETFGVSVVLVEHNMRVVMNACEEVHVLDHGETIAHGTPGEVRSDPNVVAAYLGEEAHA